MSEELKPVKCGCGGKPVVEKHQLYEEQIEDMFIVRCTKCDIQTSPEYEKEKAIEVWNRAMRRAKVYILPSALEDEMPFCPHCGDELGWE